MGTKDVLQPGCGAEIVGENEREFAAAVVRVLGDNGRAKRLSDAGKEYVKSWLAPVMARRMAGLYGRVVEEYRAHALNDKQQAES
jgi:hypothetical protein